MTNNNCIFPVAVIEAEFTAFADVLKRYGLVRNTALKAAEEGRLPRPWRLKGALYFRNRDLEAHDAKITAALAAPAEADALS